MQFTSDGRQNIELDIRIGKASADMREFQRSVLVKKELTKTAPVSSFNTEFLPNFANGHERCKGMNVRAFKGAGFRNGIL